MAETISKKHIATGASLAAVAGYAAYKLQHPDIALPDYIYATAQSAGSAYITKLPAKYNPVGYSPEPSYVDVRWRHAAFASNTIKQWIEYPGQPTSGKVLPKGFSMAAITHINREAMREHLQHNGGVAAMAYKLGSTVMHSAETVRPIMKLNPRDNNDLVNAMRSGKDDLHIIPGAYNPDRDHGDRFVPLEHGVTAGLVVPSNALPNFIPLI